MLAITVNRDLCVISTNLDYDHLESYYSFTRKHNSCYGIAHQQSLIRDGAHSVSMVRTTCQSASPKVELGVHRDQVAQVAWNQ